LRASSPAAVVLRVVNGWMNGASLNVDALRASSDRSVEMHATGDRNGTPIAEHA
jgi:hypothetical protein